MNEVLDASVDQVASAGEGFLRAHTVCRASRAIMMTFAKQDPRLSDRQRIEIRRGVSFGLMSALAIIAWANLFWIIHGNQRGIGSLQGIGIYSVVVSFPVTVLCLLGWYRARSSDELRLLRGLVLVPTIVAAAILAAFPWKWYV